uniref:Uncharacterized protein n=1 Tax=Anguilla anguilla TaxID=7936 RepID=A0A0E9V6X6_ANGAN
MIIYLVVVLLIPFCNCYLPVLRVAMHT